MNDATERLRAMLDERGVEWRGGLPTETMVEADGLDLLYVALPDGRVRAFIRNYLTPEQAIEATLGGDLKAENEMLRKELAVTNPLFETLNAANDRLIYENMKLRKLVRDALTTISWCTIDCYPSDNKKRELNERARELGVEA